MVDLTPYTLRSRDITERRLYVGRDVQFEELYRKIRCGENTVIMGPRGIGKTQFLNCAFNEEKRKELAEEKIFVSRLYNGISDDADTFFRTVAGSLVDDADIFLELDDENAQRIYKALHAKAQVLQDRKESGQGCLGSLCKFFMSKGFTAYVVIDSFEQFVNSRHITEDHHNVLRNFLANTTLRLVVATDFDFNKSTLPQKAAGSLLLQLFAGNEITLPGLSIDECARFLESFGKKRDFDDEEIKILYRLSGGIPYLLCKCAYFAHLQKTDSSSTSKIDWKQVTGQLLESERGLFEDWAKHLDQKEISLLKDRARDGVLSSINKDEWDSAVAQLSKRGLILDLSYSDVIERRYMYPISSVMFKLYCSSPNTKLEAYCEETSPLPIIQEIHKHEIHNHFEPGSSAKFLAEGATDNSHTINADQVFVSNGITLPELISLIANPSQASLPTGDFQQLLGTALKDRFSNLLADSTLPVRGAESGDEYELIRDRHFSAVSSKMLPDIQVNEDNEAVIEVATEELLTIDQRFKSIRHRRPTLTDDVLMCQSERCQLYLKLSVIVEDALGVVGPFMEDYSPQLVLYGKTLEQSLRDNLYLFFSTDPVISVYDTLKRTEDPTSKNAFKNLNRDLSFIGSYIYMLKADPAGKLEHISNRCVDYGITINGKTQELNEWTDWWNELKNAIAKAKMIRDKTDHSGKSAPNKTDLDNMCKLLFGDSSNHGVLARLTTGSDLAIHQNANGDSKTIQELENTQCEAVIAKIKQGNALDCTICGSQYIAKISKSAVNTYLLTHHGINLSVGLHINVKLGLYELQDGNEFFHATLV